MTRVDDGPNIEDVSRAYLGVVRGWGFEPGGTRTMSADHKCPTCDGWLLDAGAVNTWRCPRCDLVVETVGKTRQRVREFYRLATDRNWRGIR